jgi:hypothetical protein
MEAQDGSTRNVLEILARRIQFLEKEEGDRTTETHSMDVTPRPTGIQATNPYTTTTFRSDP